MRGHYYGRDTLKEHDSEAGAVWIVGWLTGAEWVRREERTVAGGAKDRNGHSHPHRQHCHAGGLTDFSNSERATYGWPRCANRWGYSWPRGRGQGEDTGPGLSELDSGGHNQGSSFKSDGWREQYRVAQRSAHETASNGRNCGERWEHAARAAVAGYVRGKLLWRHRAWRG